MADTRKDKRAPISLKVRFKSATLDEFIEQYSADISRGGIFIKSKTPMSVGTLLKFEFQLKDESRLIHGVGRVVWKRDEASASDDAPPGMGIKFIKMDPESRGLVEKMVQSRGDAPGRFEEGADGPKSQPAKKSGGFFPETTPEDELPPPEDRTQVRHASEFLASALAEGGSDSADEAEKKAEEARKRTEEIERKRKEAKKRRKPRIKKTLVGMGIPKGVDAEEAAKALKEDLEKKAAPLGVSDSAETVAIDRESLEKAQAASAAEDGQAPATEPEAKDEPAEDKVIVAADAEAKADEPKDEEKAEAKAEEKESSDDDAPEQKGDKAEKADKAAAKAEPEAKADKPKAEPEKKKKTEKKAAEKKAKKPEKKAEKKPPAKPAAKPAVSESRPAAAKVAAAQEPDEQPSRMGMIFFAFIAAAAIGVIVWMQMNNRDETPPAPDESAANDTAVEEPVEDVVEDPVEEPVEEPIEEPVVETTGVQVNVTPAEAVVYVDGVQGAPGSQEVELPIGQESTVSAQLRGYTEASEVVTAVEGEEMQEVSLTLEAMPWVIAVVTSPEGARVRGPRGRLTAPGDITLRGGEPSEAIGLTATLRGHLEATASVEPSGFNAEDGRMVAHVTITLEPRPAPVRTPTSTRRGGRASSGADRGGAAASGGGDTGGGSTGSGSDSGGDTGGAGDTGGGGGGDTGGGSDSGGGGGDTGGGSDSGGGGGDTGGGGGDTGGGGGDTGGGGGDSGGGEEPQTPPDNPFG